MIARAFTNVYKYFISLSACASSLYDVKPAPALNSATASPLSNFKGAAKRAAAASFVSCQILKAATIAAAAKAAPALQIMRQLRFNDSAAAA